VPRKTRNRRLRPVRAPARRPSAPAGIATPPDAEFPAVPDRAGDIAPHVRSMLAAIGEDPDREGLLKTPERVEKAFRFLTKGYHEDIDRLLNNALFSVCYDEMVVVKDIDLFSICEHHLLPFFGKAHVAYIPKDKVIGLSKIPRLIDAFARRLQVQERLTVQIAQAIQEKIRPRGVGVIIEAMHFCMIMRGVEKQNSVAVTSCMLGGFRDQLQTREEFLALIRRPHDRLG
jgi:GTP cyclohydrolase I